jgi:hypothetical protein
MTSLQSQMLQLHKSLARKNIPHAFGGALALAWCTQQARGTIDIDINIFISPGVLFKRIQIYVKCGNMSIESKFF